MGFKNLYLIALVTILFINDNWWLLVRTHRICARTHTHTYAQNTTIQLVKNEIYRIKIYSNWPVAFHFILMLSV